MNKEKLSYVIRLLLVLPMVYLLLFLALGATVKSVADVGFFLLFLTALVLLLCRFQAPISFRDICKAYWPLHLSMAGLMIALIISQLGNWDFVISQYDKLLRLLLFPFILWVIIMVPVRYLKYVQWAMLVGILLGVVKGYVVTDGGRLPNSGSVGFLAGVVFANMVLLIGTWLLMTVRWQENTWTWATLLKVLGFAGALYVSYMLKTRGTWLAIPVFLVLLCSVFKDVGWRVKVTGMLFLVCAVTIAYTSSPMMRERTHMIVGDIQKYHHGETKTSGGERIALWHAALLVAKEHPLFGIGHHNLEEEMLRKAASGDIPLHITRHGHMHNEFLGYLMQWGIGGLLADILLYLVPAMYFWRYRNNEDAIISSSAYMGIVLCIGFVIFNMTDTMMHWRPMYGFYVTNVALFFGMILRSEYEIGQA